MSLLLLAYPRLAKADHEWIQRLRARHNPEHFKLVGPHFTLVFPVDDMAVDRFTAHAGACLKDAPQIRFVLRRAMAVNDPPHRESHVFLVPDEGHEALVALHRRLYTGPLAGALRSDIAFTPHITVGNSTDHPAAAALAREIDAAGMNIPGTIDAVNAVRLQRRKVETLERFRLPP